MNLKYRKLWLLIGWSMIATVWYLSLTPKPPEMGIKLWDKLNHFIAYAVLMGWFGQLYLQKAQRIFWFVFFISMGISIEIFQGMGEHRFFEYNDMLANTLGVVSAIVVLLLKGDRVLSLFEQRILKVS
jgi:VanZ family protein